MVAKTFRKWCYVCKKMGDINPGEEKCPLCGTIIPIPPHEKFGYAAPPAPGIAPPPPGVPPPPPPEGPTHEDIIEILDRIEKRIDRLGGK